MSQQPNILLVVLDSLRAENTSLHGYRRQNTPFLNRFQNEVYNYQQARAPGMTSLPSHTSIFTGLHVAEHRAHDSILHKTTPGITVWDELREEGYETGVFSYNVNLIDESSSLRESFNYVSPRLRGIFPESSSAIDYLTETGDNPGDPWTYLRYVRWALGQNMPIKSFANGLFSGINETIASARLEQAIDYSADRYVDLFLDWIGDQTGPWAACINLLDAHHPYYPQSRFDRWGGASLQRRQSKLDPHPWKVYGGQVSWEDWKSFEDLYDGTIRQLDWAVERLITELKKRDVFNDTLVVITADHGEGFGERSRVRPDMRIAGHVVGLHECLLHVPLLVSFPGQSEGRTIEDLATLTRFPWAVQAAINDDWTGTEFIPEGPVIASGSNLENKLKSANRAQRYVEDTDRFGGTVRAVYRSDGRAIYKYLTWGEDAVTVRIDGNGARAVGKATVAQQEVDALFGEIEDADVLLHREDAVADSTMQRLTELGYV